MNYSALIQNRKSAREFSANSVPAAAVAQIEAFYKDGCHRLLPGLRTELRIFGTEAKAELERAAGYEDFLVGAPNYLVLLSEQAPNAGVNAGYMMEDLILKLTEMGLGSCWINRAREVFDSAEGKQLLAHWGVEGDYIGVGNCILGYPDEEPVMKPRKPDYIRYID